MKYVMRKSHYAEGFEPEMLCIQLTEIQAATLYSQMLNTPYSAFASGHFTVCPPAVHVHLEQFEGVAELFEHYGIIPSAFPNEEFYKLFNKLSLEEISETRLS
jgi:hypothetical protein